MSETDNKVEKAKELAKKLRRDARKLEKAAGVSKGTRADYQRQYMAQRTAAERDIVIRKCENPDRRAERLAEPLKFLKGYFPDRFWRPFSDDQIDGIETVIYCAQTGADELIAAARGDWKRKPPKH